MRPGDAARATAAGRRMYTNGWTFWQYEDALGNMCQLDTARQQLLDRRTVDSVEKPRLRLAGRYSGGRSA